MLNATNAEPAFCHFDLFFKCSMSPALRPEAVVRRCFVKKVFLKISQHLKENTRAGVSFY